MATANPLREDNYELELSQVREKIKSKFVELIDCLKARENELLRELDNILASYLSYRIELEKVNEKKTALERTKIFVQKELPNSPVKSVHEDFIARVNTELKSIETPIEPKMVSFECDSNEILAKLNNLGKLVDKVSGIDYKSKKQRSDQLVKVECSLQFPFQNIFTMSYMSYIPFDGCSTSRRVRGWRGLVVQN